MIPTSLQSPPAPPAADPSTPPREPRRPRVVPLGLRLAFELLVVFAGVYAASALAAHQERIEEEAHRRQVQRALIEEIESITATTRVIAASLEQEIARFDSLVAAGTRVPLVPMLDPARPRTHMWEATLQSNVLDLLDVPTVYRLSQFYNELSFGLSQLDQMQRLSEAMLLPRAGEDPAVFYDPERNRLRPEFAWYRMGMGNVRRAARSVTVLGDSLMVDLRPAEASP